MIGTTVSHYRIIGSIGAGGMGVVYLAEDEHLTRKVALKFLPPAIAQDQQARARLVREAQAASALDHPNVATVYDVDEWSGQFFIAMSYYEGDTLRQRIERGALTVVEAARIAGQIASGLAAAHRAGIVHRDVKPANVMLMRDGQVKILDFGLAKFFADTAATMTRMAGPGTTLGTVAYMAPEQAAGGEVDARADVWALGVTMYEMLTGRLPFQGMTAPALMLAAASQAPTPITDIRPDVPEPLASLVHRALEKDVAHRTITADDIAQEIAGSLTTESGSRSVTSAPRSGQCGDESIPSCHARSRFERSPMARTCRTGRSDRMASGPSWDRHPSLTPSCRPLTYSTGHNIPRPELIRESLAWLDKYLGLPQ